MAAPASTLIQDTTQAALMRALGFERDEIERNSARLVSDIDDTVAFEAPEIEYQGGLSRRGILQGRRSQGLQSSSYTRRLIGEQQRWQGRMATSLEMDAARARGNVESERASQISALERRLAEGGLAAADRLARSDAQRSLG